MEKIISAEKYNDLMEKSSHYTSDYIRTSSFIINDKGLINYKFKTANKTAYFMVSAENGDLHSIWEILVNISKNKNGIFISADNRFQEIITYQCIDNNVRITIMNNNWYEQSWDFKAQTAKLTQVATSNNEHSITFDEIIDKKDFIYNFYMELPKEWMIKENTKESIQKIDAYLGYIPATDLDLKLHKNLMLGNIDETKTLLEAGANPNAIISEDEYETIYIFDDFIQNFVDQSYSAKVEPLIPDDITDEECDKIENQYISYRKELSKKEHELTKILVDYGAKLTSLFPAIYNSSEGLDNIKFLLDKNMKYDMETLGFIATDEQICGDEKCQKYYAQIEKWFDEYQNTQSYDFKMEDIIIEYLN